MTKSSGRHSKDDLFNFENLKLVEKPDSPLNAQSLRQNLEDCEGYLKMLPLKLPNVDQKDPVTIADMVNILTSPAAAITFADTKREMDEEHGRQTSEETTPHRVYDYKHSQAMQQQLTSMHKRTKHVTAPGVFGHVVNPGCISFYRKDGKTYAVTEGRWWLASLKARWCEKNLSLNKDLVKPQMSQVLIMRVLPGEVGLIREQGVEILLDVGTHVFNSGTVTIVGKKRYAEAYAFSHGRYHYVRVPRGKFAKVLAEVRGPDGIQSVVPRLLQQGEHYVDSHLFVFDALVDLKTTYIQHGSVNRISVDKGLIAKVFQDNKPRLLGEGDHLVESTQFIFDGTASIITNNFIVHGTITLLRVSLGKVALAWRDSEPVFITDPGLYEFDSLDFSFVEFKSAEDRIIVLGAKKIIIVHTGQVAVTYDQGVLKILWHGRHTINSSTHVFYSFLSTQQKSIRLATLDANARLVKMSKRVSKSSGLIKAPMLTPDSDMTICETRDLVKVGLRADVFYSIEDPEKCLNKIDPDELEDLVRETAVATLTNIIRSTALNELCQSKQVSAGRECDVLSVLQPPLGNEAPSPSAPMAMFFEKAHDEFLEKLHDDFMSKYGVNITNIRIESFKLMSEELSYQISSHALTTAQIENEMANLEGKSKIATTKQRTAAEVLNIQAESEAAALKTAADALNQRKIDEAQAEAESSKIRAQAVAEAEAEAILTKAKAEAEAIKLKAAAEAERAVMLSNTNFGVQEALLTIYSDMVVRSNEGVDKIVYLDPSVNKESPFALGSLQNLNNDLHSLTHLGIAANGSGPKEAGRN